MFAYCNNQPVNHLDSTGNRSVNTTTEVVKETPDGTYYKTTVIVDNSFMFLGLVISSDVVEYTFYFWVNSSGIISFDNKQDDAQMLNTNDIIDKLVDEMMRVAISQVPEALSGRTKEGIILELRAHYTGYKNAIKTGNTITTEIGGTDVNKPGFDYNADWFEHPLMNLPGILNGIFRK